MITEEELGLALRRESSEVDIEYRAKPTRKHVQVKSAETHRLHEQKSTSLSSKQQRSANKDARSKGSQRACCSHTIICSRANTHTQLRAHMHKDIYKDTFPC